VKKIILLFLIALGGCSSLGGNASYTYVKTDKELKIEVESGRTLKQGFDVTINPDGTVSVITKNAEQGRPVIDQDLLWQLLKAR
jgi:hypothetical protein